MAKMAKNEKALSPDARLATLFDAGTFVRLGAYVKREKDGEAEGVVCGYGAVNGRLTFAFLQDSGKADGAFDARSAKKIGGMYRLAVQNGAPVVGVFDCAGVCVTDGASALGAYASLMKDISDASGVIPQIAVVGGGCGGLSAVCASLFDFTVTVKDQSAVSVAPASVAGKDLADASFGASRGLSSYAAADEADAFAFVKSLLAVLPQNNADSVVTGNGQNDDPNRAVNVAGLSGKELVEALADGGKVTPVFADYAKTVFCGFCAFDGVASGVIASAGDGALDVAAARVIAKMASFCDAFRLPLVSLVDSVGEVKDLAEEEKGLASELAKAAMAIASSENAKLAVLTGKAYGAALPMLASVELGFDMVLAAEGATVSVLSPEASVAFVWNDRIAAEGKTRAELETEWKETVASAETAASNGAIDGIVPAASLRAYLCSALGMICSKAEGKPDRRHGAMPL